MSPDILNLDLDKKIQPQYLDQFNQKKRTVNNKIKTESLKNLKVYLLVINKDKRLHVL